MSLCPSSAKGYEISHHAHKHTFLDAVQTTEPVSGLTHNFYRYPARFSPALARRSCVEDHSAAREDNDEDADVVRRARSNRRIAPNSMTVQSAGREFDRWSSLTPRNLP